MQITDMAFVGNNLYVGGTFTNVNGVAVKGLAKWDGTAWVCSVGFSGSVVALAADGNNLYVGGLFTNPGGVAATNIAYAGMEASGMRSAMAWVWLRVPPCGPLP